jgi:hypothetical protein
MGYYPAPQVNSDDRTSFACRREGAAIREIVMPSLPTRPTYLQDSTVPAIVRHRIATYLCRIARRPFRRGFDLSARETEG